MKSNVGRVQPSNSSESQLVHVAEQEHIALGPAHRKSGTREKESCRDKASDAISRFKRGCRCKRGFSMDLFSERDELDSSKFSRRVGLQEKRKNTLMQRSAIKSLVKIN